LIMFASATPITASAAAATVRPRSAASGANAASASAGSSAIRPPAKCAGSIAPVSSFASVTVGSRPPRP